MARPKKCGRCRKSKRPKHKDFADKEGYCECGRPTVVTPEVIDKLEKAFSYGIKDKEACFLAGIHVDSLYSYQKKNPKFAERKEQLKRKPDIMAKKTAVESLKLPQYAWRWLERRNPDFMPTSKTQTTLEVKAGESSFVDMSEEEKKALDEFQKARRKRIEGSLRNLPD